jgi:hypothetical protein
MPTCQQLIDKARRRVDAFGSDTFSDTEVVDYLNLAMLELFSLIVKAQGEDAVSSYTIYSATADGNSTSVLLYPPPYKLISVQLLTSDGYVPLRKTNRATKIIKTEKKDWLSDETPTYDFRMNYLHFSPNAKSTYTIRVQAVNPPTQLSTASPSTSIEFIYDPWEQFIVLGAAAHMLDRIEQDPTVVLTQKEQIKDAILGSGQNDQNGYEVVADVEGKNRSIRDIGFPWEG